MGGRSVLNLFILMLRRLFRRDRPADLLEACLSGNPEEIRRFVRHYTPLIRARARAVLFGARGGYGRLVSREDLDDLVQTTFEVLFRDGARTLRGYDGSRGMSLDGYIGLIAQRESHNFMDRMHARKRGAGAPDVPLEEAGGTVHLASSMPGPDRALETREDREALEAALLDLLSEKGRLFYQLMYVEELETDEIVQALGVNRDVVYTWRRRILKTCEEVLREAGGPGR